MIPDYLAMVDEAVKEFESRRPPETERTFTHLRDTVTEPGTWHVVMARSGSIRVVRQARGVDRKRVTAVWTFRRVTIGQAEWMIGVRDDGAEIAWCG